MANGVSNFSVGNQFSHQFRATRALVDGFRELSGDVNPIHVDSEYARSKGFDQTIVFGNALGIGLSYLIGMALPIKEVIILKQSLKYHKPVYLDDSIHISATVRQVTEVIGAVDMDLVFKNQNEQLVADGKILIKCI